MTTNCDPCDCPEQYYRDTKSFRKAVINLLCRISNLFTSTSTTFTVGNVFDAPYNLINNNIGLPTGYSPGDIVYYKFYVATQAPNSGGAVVFSSLPFFVGPVTIVDSNQLLQFTISVTDADYGFIRVLRKVNNGAYDHFIDVGTDFTDTGVMDGGSSGAIWGVGSTVTPASPYSYTPTAGSQYYVENLNDSHFTLSHLPIVAGSVTGFFKNAQNITMNFSDVGSGNLVHIGSFISTDNVGSIDFATGVVTGNFTILEISYENIASTNPFTLGYYTENPNTSNFTLVHIPDVRYPINGLYRDSLNNVKTFVSSIVNINGILVNILNGASHYNPDTAVGTVNNSTGVVAANFNILQISYYTP